MINKIKANMSVAERERLILSTLSTKDMTVSEIIDTIWDGMSNEERVSVGWRFFVHLNKLFIILERKKKVIVVGSKQGYMNRTEKIWRAI